MTFGYTHQQATGRFVQQGNVMSAVQATIQLKGTQSSSIYMDLLGSSDSTVQRFVKECLDSKNSASVSGKYQDVNFNVNAQFDYNKCEGEWSEDDKKEVYSFISDSASKNDGTMTISASTVLKTFTAQDAAAFQINLEYQSYNMNGKRSELISDYKNPVKQWDRENNPLKFVDPSNPVTMTPEMAQLIREGNAQMLCLTTLMLDGVTGICPTETTVISDNGNAAISHHKDGKTTLAKGETVKEYPSESDKLGEMQRLRQSLLSPTPAPTVTEA